MKAIAESFTYEFTNLPTYQFTNLPISECGQRVYRESSSASNGHGRDGDHELLPVQSCGGCRNGLEILIVEQIDPHRGDQERVDRQRHAFHPRRHDVFRRVAADDRDAAGLDPWRNRRVEPGGALADVPRTELRAPRPASGPEQDDVAGGDLHAGLLFPRLDVLGVDGGAGLEVLDAFQARNVDQHATRDDAALQIVDAEFRAALLGVHFRARVA